MPKFVKRLLIHGSGTVAAGVYAGATVGGSGNAAAAQQCMSWYWSL